MDWKNFNLKVFVFLALEIVMINPLRWEPLGTSNGMSLYLSLPKSGSSTFSFSIAELVNSILFISSGGLLWPRFVASLSVCFFINSP